MPKKIDISRIPSNDLERRGERPAAKLIGSVESRPRGSNAASHIQSISSYLFDDVILPALKSTVADFVTTAINMLVWGEGGRGVSNFGSRHVNYNKRYSRSVRREPILARTHRDSMGLDDLVFSNMRDAENVLAQVLERIAEYGFCSVGDLYSMVGWTSNFNHENYGWTNLSNVRIHNTREGSIINFPNPEYISN